MTRRPSELIIGLNHVGLAAKDPEKARWFFNDVLQLPFFGDELIKDQQTLTSMFASSHSGKHFPTRLELLENDGENPGPIKKFIDTRGGGIHHIALNVTSVESIIAHLEAHKVELINQHPKEGAHNTRIVFVHPRSTGGILVEFVEELNQ